MKRSITLSFRLYLTSLLMMAPPAARAASLGNADKERAASAIETDLKTDPNNAELWVHLGFAYRKLDKIDQATNAFQKATTLDPKSKDAFFMLGLIYESKHNNAEAEKAWKSYLAIETDAAKRDMAEKHIHHLSE